MCLICLFRPRDQNLTLILVPKKSFSVWVWRKEIISSVSSPWHAPTSENHLPKAHGAELWGSREGRWCFSRRTDLVQLLQQLRGATVTKLLQTKVKLPLEGWSDGCSAVIIGFSSHGGWCHCTDRASDVLLAWESGILIVTEHLHSLENLGSNGWADTRSSRKQEILLVVFYCCPNFTFLYMSKNLQPNFTRVSNPSHKLSESKWFGRVEEFLTHEFILYHTLGYQEKEQSIQESISSVLVWFKPREESVKWETTFP